MAPTKLISTSVGFQDSKGNLVANGLLSLTLSQNALVTATNGQVTTEPIYFPLDANAKITSTAIWFNDELTPAGTTYKAVLYASNGCRIIQDFGFWSITGASADLSTMVPTSIGGPSAAGVVLLNPSGGALQTITGSLEVTSDAIFKTTPWIDIRAYGATTGATDNSTAIQSAINAAISAGQPVYIPPGTWQFATTLTVNSTTKGVTIRGGGMHPSVTSASILKYTGATTALQSDNGTGFTYGHYWYDIGIMAGANATNGVSLKNVSDSRFFNVGLWNDGTHQFTNGWNCAGCFINYWDGWVVSMLAPTGTTNAVRLTSTAQSASADLIFDKADTFQVTNVFNIDGNGNKIVDRDGYHEAQDVYLLVDDTSTLTNVTAFNAENVTWLFDGALASFTNSVAMKINNVAGKIMALHEFNFHGGRYFTNQAVAYPMLVTMANAGSAMTMGIGGNISFQGATTGLINSSLVAAAQLRVDTHGYESVDSSLANLGTFIGGTGASSSQYEFGGITSNQGITLNAASSFLAVGVSPSASGIIRIPNNVAITGHDNAASQFNLIYAGNDNKVHLGTNTIVDSGSIVATILSASGTFVANGATGKVSTYNSIATVSNGVPSEYATVDLTAQAAAVGTTTLYAVPASGAGQYRLSWDAKVTTAATTGAATSTLGALTIVYTDPDGVAVTLTAPAMIAAGTIATTSTGNTTGTVLVGLPLTLNAKASTNITYAFAYASDTANQMAYNLHIKLEAL